MPALGMECSAATPSVRCEEARVVAIWVTNAFSNVRLDGFLIPKAATDLSLVAPTLGTCAGETKACAESPARVSSCGIGRRNSLRSSPAERPVCWLAIEKGATSVEGRPFDGSLRNGLLGTIDSEPREVVRVKRFVLHSRIERRRKVRIAFGDRAASA